MEQLILSKVLNMMNYDLCLELVERLEIVKKFHLRNSPVIPILAKFVHKYDVKDVGLLNQVAASLLSAINGESKVRTQTIAQWINPQELVEADILLKEISPWVNEIRKDIFNKDESPFTDRESALKWLKEYSLSDQEISDEVLKAKEASIEEDTQVQLIAIEGQLFLPKTPPANIYHITKDFADNTGINHPSLIMHVLTNSRIICQKWDCDIGCNMQTLPSGNKTKAKSITVRFRDTLSLGDMRQLYRNIKGEFGFKKSKALNAKHLELFRLVEEMGIPKKGKVTFWEKLTEEWNRRHPESKYSTWKGVNMAYNRIRKNADRRLYGVT